MKKLPYLVMLLALIMSTEGRSGEDHKVIENNQQANITENPDCPYCYDAGAILNSDGVNIDTCDVNNTDGVKVRIISPGDNLSELFRYMGSGSKYPEKNVLHDVFCFKPGIYTGTLHMNKFRMVSTIGSGGPEEHESTILLRPMNPGTTYDSIYNYLEPWKKPASLEDPNVIPDVPTFTGKVRFYGTKNVVIRGLRFFRPSVQLLPSDAYSQAAKNNNIIFDNVLIEGQAPGKTQLSVQSVNNIYIQNSVIRNSDIEDDDGETHCIGITSKNNFITVTRNEIYNCTGDGLQLQSYYLNDDTVLSNVTIDRNHFYQEDSMQEECDATPAEYKCSKGENGIDIKATSQDSMALVTNNIFNGFGQQMGSDWMGSALIVHYGQSTNIEIANNIIYDSTGGISVDKNSKTVPNGIFIHHNLIYNFIKKAFYLYGDNGWSPDIAERIEPDYLFWAHNTIKWGESMLKLPSETHGIEFSHPVDQSMFVNNLFIGPEKKYPISSGKGALAYPSFNNNIFDNTKGSCAVFSNTFVNTSQVVANQTPDFNLVYNDISEDVFDFWFDRYCFAIKPLTGPEQKCIERVVPTLKSPFMVTADPERVHKHPIFGDLLNKQNPFSDPSRKLHLPGELPATKDVATTPGFIDPASN